MELKIISPLHKKFAYLELCWLAHFLALLFSFTPVMKNFNLEIDVLKTFLKKHHVTKVVKRTTVKEKPMLVLPYLGQQLLKIRNRIQSCLKESILSSSLTLSCIML